MNRRINPQKPPRVSVLAAKAIMVQSAKVLPLALVIGLLVGLVGARVADGETTERDVMAEPKVTVELPGNVKRTLTVAGKGNANKSVRIRPGLYHVIWYTSGKANAVVYAEHPTCHGNDHVGGCGPHIDVVRKERETWTDEDWEAMGASVEGWDQDTERRYREYHIQKPSTHCLATRSDQHSYVILAGPAPQELTKCHLTDGERFRLDVSGASDTDYWVISFERIATSKALNG